MYISFIVTDQDLHLGLLESPSCLLIPWLCAFKVPHFCPHTTSCVTSIRVQVSSRDTCQVALLFKSHITLSSSTQSTLLDSPFSSHIVMIGFSSYPKAISYSFKWRTPRNPKSPKSGYVCGGHNKIGHTNQVQQHMNQGRRRA